MAAICFSLFWVFLFLQLFWFSIPAVAGIETSGDGKKQENDRGHRPLLQGKA